MCGAVAAAGPLVLAASAADAGTSPFRHGVASGDPLPDGILLWTRVPPTDDALPGSGRGPVVTVAWQVARDPSLTQIAAGGQVQTGPDRDHTVKIDVNGLQSATTYWYRFGLAGAWSRVGRTRTAPAYDADLASLRLGVVSCSNWESGYFAAYRHLAARGDLDAVVHLGDYIYEYKTGESSGPNWTSTGTGCSTSTPTGATWTGSS